MTHHHCDDPEHPCPHPGCGWNLPPKCPTCNDFRQVFASRDVDRPELDRWYACPDCTTPENVEEPTGVIDDPLLMQAALVSSDAVVERIYRRLTTPENVETVDSPPPGKHRRPPTLAMELAGEAPCPDCWTPENEEEPT